MYNCLSIANCIIDTFYKKFHRNITILELLKYQFLCHGWYLAEYGKPLFEGTIIAFPLGPVVEEVYQGFNDDYRNNYTIIKEHNNGNKNEIPIRIKGFIERIMNEYTMKKGVELADITHLSGTPWSTTILEKGLYQRIDDDLICKYYKDLKLKDIVC